jgi:hypothetical protein
VYVATVARRGSRGRLREELPLRTSAARDPRTWTTSKASPSTGCETRSPDIGLSEEDYVRDAQLVADKPEMLLRVLHEDLFAGGL